MSDVTPHILMIFDNSRKLFKMATIQIGQGFPIGRYTLKTIANCMQTALSFSSYNTSNIRHSLHVRIFRVVFFWKLGFLKFNYTTFSESSNYMQWLECLHSISPWTCTSKCICLYCWLWWPCLQKLTKWVQITLSYNFADIFHSECSIPFP